jgi:hypothetical protein
LIPKIDISVPPIDAGRTTEHCELWSICRLLATLSKYNLLEYPLLLNKRERPDFNLIADKRNVGIELTEGIQPDYARARVLPEAELPISILDSSFFKRGALKKSLTKLRSLASQNKLTGLGWEGNEVEVELAQAIYDITQKKTRKLQNSFRKLQLNNIWK